MNWLVDADVTEPDIAPQVVASGGTESVITVNGKRYRVHVFTSDDTFTVTTAGDVECFLIGGGGAGGQTLGTFDSDFASPNFAYLIATGGGGAGGVVNAQVTLPSAGSYAITVGAGGQIDTTLADDEPLVDPTVLNGEDSKITFSGTDLVTAKGGGGGGISRFPDFTYDPFTDGQDGASGGGGVSVSLYSISSDSIVSQSQTSAGSSIVNQGTDGADGQNRNEFSDEYPNLLATTLGGGGGGALVEGGVISSLPSFAPDGSLSGGNGIISKFSGTDTKYSGGGGASVLLVNFVLLSATFPVSVTGLGGLGGGGNGAYSIPGEGAAPSTAGTNGLGGGGGGGLSVVIGDNVKDEWSKTDGVISNQAANGGSGIVMIRYPIEG